MAVLLRMVPTRVPPSFALSRSLQHGRSPADPVCSGGYGCGSGAAGDSCITLSLLSTQQPGLTGPPPPPSLPPSLSLSSLLSLFSFSFLRQDFFGLFLGFCFLFFIALAVCYVTHSIDQAGLDLQVLIRNPPVSASQVLGIKVCVSPHPA